MIYIPPVAVAKMGVILLESKKKEHVQNGSLIIQNALEPGLPALAFYPERDQNEEIKRKD